MAKKKIVQSVEPNIANLVNGWFNLYKVDYKLEQESLNTEIDQSLIDYFSKNSGKGGNRPDAKILLHANDSYMRSDRKKATKNLFDTDRAKERYREVIDWVLLEKQSLVFSRKKSTMKGTLILRTAVTGTNLHLLILNQLWWIFRRRLAIILHGKYLPL